MSTTDRIEKEALLKAPQSRVWRALTDSKEFSTWFRVDFIDPFEVGRTIKGKITHPGYEHMTMAVQVDRIDPESYFSYRWHPYAIDPNVDYSSEPTTLVEFRLEPSGEGTRLRIIESGFDRLPTARRDEAFRMNDNGWTGQIKAITKHVEG